MKIYNKELIDYYKSRKMFLKNAIDIEKNHYYVYNIYNETLFRWGLTYE